MNLYWCSTHIMPADGLSRKIDFNEEFLPQEHFDLLFQELKLVPEIDLMATRANAKCRKYCSLDHRDKKASCIDFFECKQMFDGIAYLFPPFNLATKVLQHVNEFLKSQPLVLILTTPGYLPITWAKMRGSLVFRREKFPFTFIPSETMTRVENTEVCGIPNTRVVATFLICRNIEVNQLENWTRL